MDGYYQGNSGNFNSSGYSQRSVNKTYGSCCNCSGGYCSRMGAGASQTQSQMQSQSMGQLSCPGGNCCPGGRCQVGKSRCHPDWQNSGR